MSYRNNTSSSLEVANLLKDMKEVKIRVDDTYTKTEIEDFLRQDNINDSELYYTKEATTILLNTKASASDLLNNYYNKTNINTLLNSKANASDLTTTNTNITNISNNLSTNYYTKTNTDTLLSSKANSTDLTTTNANITNISNNLSANYYSKTNTDTLLSSKANSTDLTTTNNNLSTNYYNKTNTDTLLTEKANASDLTTTNNNITNLSDSLLTNYYNKTSTDTLLNAKASTTSLSTTNNNLTNLTNNLSTNYYTKTEIDGMGGNVDLTNYYNKTETNTLLNDKASTTSLTTTNNNVTTISNNLSNNYYNKTQVDTITSQFLTETQVESEISNALETIAPNLVVWNSTLNANSFNYSLPYDENFVDTTQSLNITSTNYNIVPAKKIYNYVENKVATSISNALNLTRNYTFGNIGLLFYADNDPTQTPIYTVNTNLLIVEYIGGPLIWVTLNFTTDVLNVPASFSGNINMLIPFDISTSPQTQDICHGDMRCTLYDENDNALNCDCLYVVTKANNRNYATWWRHVYFILNRPTQTSGNDDVYLNTSLYKKIRIMGSFTYCALFPPAGLNNYSLVL